MSRAIAVFLLVSAMPAFAGTGATFSCQRLMVESLAGAGPDDFLPSVVGDVTLDGRGGYGHVQGGGKVALDKGLTRFTSGPLMGTVGMLRKDAKGRTYFHIDKSVTDPPRDLPRALDLVCYKK